MFCPYCGNFCAEAHKFCYRCGKPLPELSAEVTIPEEPIPAGSDTEEIIPVPVSEEAAEAQAEETITEEDSSVSEEAAEPDTEEPPAESVVPETKPKKGRLWPPILALCVMICMGLSAFFLSGGTAEKPSCFTVDNGVLYFDYSLYTGSNELTVPETVDGMIVTAISDGCFRDCDRLTTVILPETVTVIGSDAFTGCDALRGIYIPHGVMSVGSNALAECPALEAVCFPQSTMEIGEGCLDHCDSLKYIFYDGTYAQWMELYEGTYPTGMELHTNDGVFTAQP